MEKLVLLLSFMLVVAPVSVLANEKVTLAAGDWEPFTSSREENANIAELIVIDAFKLVDIDVELKYFPWKRSFEMTKKGDFVGTFPWQVTKDREKDFYISEQTILVEKTVFFHLKDNEFNWETLDDLKKYKIGVTIGYSSENILEAKGIKVSKVPKEDLNYKKLLKSRIDAYPAAFFVGYYQINMLFDPAKAALFTNHSKPLSEDGYHMLISKNIPNGKELVAKFDKGLKMLKESGAYDVIIDKSMTKQ